MYMPGNTGLMTLTFGRLTTAHVRRLFTAATSLPLDFWSLDQKSTQDKTMGNKNKMKIKQENKMKKLGLGGAAAGGVPRAADGEGASCNLVRPKLAAC